MRPEFWKAKFPIDLTPDGTTTSAVEDAPFRELSGIDSMPSANSTLATALP